MTTTRAPRPWQRPALEAALVLLLTLVALLPRVLNLGLFATHDEVEFWIDRSYIFLSAIQSGDFAATAISTHPGVTTMWLGSGGILLREHLFSWDILHSDPFPQFLALLRLPGALVHTAGVLLGYALLRRMLPVNIALLAVLLWAADPFVIAYSRLLHVDALLATFATLSLLAACVYWHHRAHPAYLVLSAACGALALLSKSPGLIVPPLIGGVWLLAWLTPIEGTEHRRQQPGVGRQLAALLAWGAVFALTIALVWPAVWADPARVYELLRIGVEAEGAQPHMTGNFFLGQRQDAPGALFYPAVVALRSTPITLLGLLLMPLAWRQARDLPAARRSLLLLLVFVVLFTLALSLFPKKFNRYLVPVFPALDILAAAGLLWGAGALTSALRQTWTRRAQWAVAGAAAMLALLNALWWHPYSIAAFNQALGGAQAGARTFSVGWGEGYNEVADWLNQQPDITGELTISRMITSLNPYLRDGAQAFFPDEGRLRDNAGYLVIYIAEVQGGPPLPPSDHFYREEPPLHIVTIHDVKYAWIYQVPPPVPQPRPARFGAHIWLRGLTLPATDEVQRGQPLVLTLHWTNDAPLPEDYWLFAHLIDPDGQRVAQADIPYPTSEWQPGRYRTTTLPLTLPADAPTGLYRVIIGLYRQESSERLPLHAGPDTQADPAISGADALLLTTLEIEE